jgi:hypothetical protein
MLSAASAAEALPKKMQKAPATSEADKLRIAPHYQPSPQAGSAIDP